MLMAAICFIPERAGTSTKSSGAETVAVGHCRLLFDCCSLGLRLLRDGCLLLVLLGNRSLLVVLLRDRSLLLVLLRNGSMLLVHGRGLLLRLNWHDKGLRLHRLCWL